MTTNRSLRSLVLLSLALCGGMAHADVQKIQREAGPLWSQDDARGKCPRVCAPLPWSGQWWTTRPNQMSVCECLQTVAVVPPPPPAPPPPPQSIPGFPLVAENGKCLDVDSGGFNARANGGRVQLWDCHGGSNQQWHLEGTAIVAANGKCLDADGGPYQSRSNGARVQVWDCHGGPNQQWRHAGGNILSTNGKCLDVNGGEFNARSNGAHITLWDCNGGPNQRWSRAGAHREEPPYPPPPPPPPPVQPVPPPPPVQPVQASPCSAIAALSAQWTQLAAWVDQHDDDGYDHDESRSMAESEKRLLQPTFETVRNAMSQIPGARKSGKKLLHELEELDRMNDDNNYADDGLQVARIARSLGHMNEECSGY